MTEFLIENVSRAVLVLVLLAAAWVVGDWLKRYIRRAGEYRGIDETVAGFAAEAARWGLIVLTILSCLGAFGISTASFAAVIAAAGLAVGLAIKGTR
ncbi:MAG: hypothetical protein R3336_03510 [Phycisphaeraceae bacterium]|nr:hypothetical protein [Phycisphaeraceae bacterium]